MSKNSFEWETINSVVGYVDEQIYHIYYREHDSHGPEWWLYVGNSAEYAGVYVTMDLAKMAAEQSIKAKFPKQINIPKQEKALQDNLFAFIDLD